MMRQLRNLQTFAPWARPLKFELYNLSTRHFGWRIDPDFMILKHLPQIALAVDIGGNWGQSVEAIRRLRPEARVVTFEPNPVLAPRLSRAYANDVQVTVNSCALSSEVGHMKLHVPTYRKFVYDGLASLDFDKAYGWLNKDRVANFNPAKLSIEPFGVEVLRLDDFALNPDFIKIDVQGHELAVLQGATATLTCNPVIMLEGARPEIVEFLSDFNMKPFALDQGRLIENKIDTVNTIFMTNEQVDTCQMVVA